MNLVSREVVHRTFGKGNVINFDGSYIEINFESGDKRFVFPDAFKNHISFKDQSVTDLVQERIKKRDAELHAQELILEQERTLKAEQNILKQNSRLDSHKSHPAIQSVFWCDQDEIDKIFEDWQVFTGEIKSGAKKGQPRRLARVNRNSVCLITKRESGAKEKERQILGLFMVGEFFDGRLSDDGLIPAHSKFRIRLSEKEAKEMPFWNYYMDAKAPEKITWNSGRHRYYDNLFTAQILKDLVSLRKDAPDHDEIQEFLTHFCKANNISESDLAGAQGSLKQVSNL